MATGGVTTLGPVEKFTTTATAAGPMVTNLQRFGYHSQPTRFVLNFNEALNPTAAKDVANYMIVSTSGRKIPIASAVYDSANHTVTLKTVDRVYLYDQFQITVNGTSPSGLTNTTGQFLEGQGGQAGTNYVQSFGESILAGPNLTMAMGRATRSRIMRTWPSERRFAAGIAARDEARAHRVAVQATHAAGVVTAVRSTPKAEAIDAVIGTFDLNRKLHRPGHA